MTSLVEKWDALAADYARATGLPCRAISLQQSDAEFCPVCSTFHKQFKKKTECAGLQLFSAYQSERWGGRYIYLCPLSCLYWCSPLMNDGMMGGALVAGPAVLSAVDDFSLGTVADRHNLDGIDDNLRSLFSGLPVISPERAGSLTALLFAQAMAGSDARGVAFFNDTDAFRHESRIGEYIHHLKTMEGDKNSDLEYPINLEKKLLSCVARGDKAKAQMVLDELIATVMVATGVDFEVIRSRLLELVVLISRAALEGGADVEQIFGLNYRYLDAVRRCRTTEDLTSWLRRIIDRFGDLVFDLRQVKHTDTILRALRFMRENFYERITLSDAAKRAGLSPDYFGKLFKAELHHPFSEYLNRLRIEEAKRLLRSGSTPLGDIAFACGFDDPSYFTRVFRRTVGTTPSHYREADRVFLAGDDSSAVG